MMSLFLPSATTGVSRIAGWCVIGATPRGGSRGRRPHDAAARVQGSARVADDGVVYGPQALHGSPSAPPIMAQRVARCDHSRAHNCLPLQKLHQEIQ
jgi:hypothetical protein